MTGILIAFLIGMVFGAVLGNTTTRNKLIALIRQKAQKKEAR